MTDGTTTVTTSDSADSSATKHIFSKPSTFYKAALKTPFSAVIFSLSALRTERRTGLSSLTEL
ncbi:hypothetical protein MJL27_25815, partial [Salmonella enterica subsp. enterica serovar Anatum]|nr:hypothetical protein [Salmonella enterica subsp. enterica serovar Anatum]